MSSPVSSSTAIVPITNPPRRTRRNPPDDATLLAQRFGNVLQIDEYNWKQNKTLYNAKHFSDLLSLNSLKLGLACLSHMTSIEDKFAHFFHSKSLQYQPVVLVMQKGISYNCPGLPSICSITQVYRILVSSKDHGNPIDLRKRNYTLFFSRKQHEKLALLIAELATNLRSIRTQLLNLVSNCSLIIIHPNSSTTKPIIMESRLMNIRLVRDLEAETYFLKPIKH